MINLVNYQAGARTWSRCWLLCRTRLRLHLRSLICFCELSQQTASQSFCQPPPEGLLSSGPRAPGFCCWTCWWWSHPAESSARKIIWLISFVIIRTHVEYYFICVCAVELGSMRKTMWIYNFSLFLNSTLLDRIKIAAFLGNILQVFSLLARLGPTLAIIHYFQHENKTMKYQSVSL